MNKIDKIIGEGLIITQDTGGHHQLCSLQEAVWELPKDNSYN